MTDTYLDSSAATTSAVTTPAAADVPAATPAYPEFNSQRRGYDRAQVDEYVSELRRFLADAEKRAAEAHTRAEELSRQLRAAAAAQ